MFLAGVLVLLPLAVFAAPVKFSFWHIGTSPADRAYWQGLADQYQKLNPNVTIEVTVLENEAFKSKVTTLMQSGNPPDVFHSWGGGVMAEYAKAGLLRDITSQVKGTSWGKSMAPGVLGVYSSNGRQYGMPFDMGAVVFWYNKDLLAKAGSRAFPATWNDLLTLVTKLKSTGVVPIALGGGDKWPSHFIWTYLAVRLGGKAAFDAVLSGKGSFNDAPFVKAGQMLLDLSKQGPFQEGFLAATYNDQAALMGNGKAAIELMGQWAPAVEASNAADKKGIGTTLAMAPFPSVPGGAGAPTDVLGGGNGYAVGKNAPDAAVDFLKFITNKENNATLAATGEILPTVIGADAAIKDPQMKLVKGVVDKAGYYQLYLDQFFAPAVGGAINDGVQQILAGALTPAQAAASIQTTFEANK
jgi:raffinose/stachyose/melibiose transport system substrate-binding protein